MRDQAIEELKQKIKDFEEISKDNDKNRRYYPEYSKVVS